MSENPEVVIEKTFTQAEVDKIISDRLKRAETSTTSKLLESLGVETLEKLQADKAAFEALQAQHGTTVAEFEALKADKAARDLELEALRTQHLETVAQVRKSRIESEISKALVGCVDVPLATGLLFKDDYLKDDETFDSEALKVALEALKTEKPYLFESVKPYKGIPSSKGSNPAPDNGLTAGLKEMDKLLQGG